MSGVEGGASRTRSYYLRAVEVDWDYLPLGRNGLTDEPLTADQKVRDLDPEA